MVINITLRGIDKLERFLKKKSVEIERLTNKGVEEAGEFLKSEIQASIKGERAESRSVSTGEFLNSVEARNGVVSSDVPQAKFLEFGTRKVHERRHFRNSADRSKHKIKDILGDALKKL